MSDKIVNIEMDEKYAVELLDVRDKLIEWFEDSIFFKNLKDDDEYNFYDYVYVDINSYIDSKKNKYYSVDFGFFYNNNDFINIYYVIVEIDDKIIKRDFNGTVYVGDEEYSLIEKIDNVFTYNVFCKILLNIFMFFNFIYQKNNDEINEI